MYLNYFSLYSHDKESMWNNMYGDESVSSKIIEVYIIKKQIEKKGAQ